MQRIPETTRNGKPSTPSFPQLEDLVVYLYGLAVQGADDEDLFARARAWRNVRAPQVVDAKLSEVVYAVLERVSRPAPNASPPTAASSVNKHPDRSATQSAKANKHPDRSATQDLQDSQDSQESQGMSKGAAAKDAATQADTNPSEKPIPPEEAARQDAAPRLGQPLAEFLAKLAGALAAGEQVGHEAVSRSGGWQSPLWAFARCCKAHPDLVRLTALKAFTKVTKSLKTLRHSQAPFDSYARANPCACVWKRWTELCDAEAEEEFFGCWDRIRFLPGHTPLESAATQAAVCPLKLLDRHREDRPSGYVKLISLAGWLQVTVGDLPILLPIRDVARFLGCGAPAVSRYIRWAVMDELLIKVTPHTFHPKSRTNKAASYRFAVDRFPVLREKLPEPKGPEEAARGSEPREES